MTETKKPKGFKRSSREWEELLVEKVRQASIEDVLKLGLFPVATYTLKEAKLIHWEALWAKPTARQEALNWASNALLAYLLIYKPEAVASAFGSVLKGLTGFLGAIM